MCVCLYSFFFFFGGCKLRAPVICLIMHYIHVLFNWWPVIFMPTLRPKSTVLVCRTFVHPYSNGSSSKVSVSNLIAIEKKQTGYPQTPQNHLLSHF